MQLLSLAQSFGSFCNAELLGGFTHLGVTTTRLDWWKRRRLWDWMMLDQRVALAEGPKKGG